MKCKKPSRHSSRRKKLDPADQQMKRAYVRSSRDMLVQQYH